jgi:dihydrofolate reductase
MHVSLDGFVAGPDGEMDWIKVNEEIFDYVGKRIAETDTALYGRVTFQMMEGYWPTAADKPNASKHDIEHSSWYAKAHKIVLSKTLKEADFMNTEVIDSDISEKIQEIRHSSGGHRNEILLFGSPTATHSLAALNLIDGYWLFVNPIILGRGIPLFAGMKDRIKLDLLSTHAFACGVIALNYAVHRE